MPRPAPHRVRRASAGACLLVLVLAATACNPGRPPAATVEGQDISATHLDAIVDAYIEEGGDEQAAALAGQGRDTVQMAAVSGLLSNLIAQVYQAELAEQEGAEPTAEERDEATTLVESSFVAGAAAGADGTPQDPTAAETSTAIYDALPAETRDWLIDLRASTLALTRVVGEGADVESEARELYEANPEAFERLCLRAIIVEAGDVATVQERLDAGDDFGAVSTELTIDPALAEAGGELGQCLTPQQLAQAGLTEDIVTVVAGLEAGEISEPLDLGDGYGYFFEVQDRQVPAFEDVAEEIAASLPDPGEAALQAFVQERQGDADITVDPRFGTWDPMTGQVVPPAGATTVATEPAAPVAPDGSVPTPSEPAG